MKQKKLLQTLEEEKFAQEEMIQQLRTRIGELEDERLSLARKSDASEQERTALSGSSAIQIRQVQEELGAVRERFAGFRRSLADVVRANAENAEVAAKAAQTMVVAPGTIPGQQPGGIVPPGAASRLAGMPGGIPPSGMQPMAGTATGQQPAGPGPEAQATLRALGLMVPPSAPAPPAAGASGPQPGQPGVTPGLGGVNGLGGVAGAGPPGFAGGFSNNQPPSTPMLPKEVFDKFVRAVQTALDGETVRDMSSRTGGAAGTVGGVPTVLPTGPSPPPVVGGVPPTPLVGTAVPPQTAAVAAAPPPSTHTMMPTGNISALQDTITSLSAENNRLRRQLAEQDNQILQLIRDGAARPTFGTSVAPAPIGTDAASTTVLPAEGVLPLGAGDLPTTAAAAEDVSIISTGNPDLDLLTRKLKQTEVLYAKVSSEYSRASERVAELSRANEDLANRLKAVDVMVAVGGEQKASVGELLDKMFRLERKNEEVKKELEAKKGLEDECRELRNDRDRLDVLKGRLEAELKHLEFLKLPEAKGVDVGAARGIRDLVEKVVALENECSNAKKELRKVKKEGADAPVEAGQQTVKLDLCVGEEQQPPASNAATKPTTPSKNNAPTTGGAKTAGKKQNPATMNANQILSVQNELAATRKKLQLATKSFDSELKDRQQVFNHRIQTLVAEVAEIGEVRDRAQEQAKEAQKKLGFMAAEREGLIKQVSKLEGRHAVDEDRIANMLDDLAILTEKEGRWAFLE